MLELKSIFDMGNALDKKGYDVFIEKQSNGLYKCWLWHFDNCLGIGKFEYETRDDAIKKTLTNLYVKIFEK